MLEVSGTTTIDCVESVSPVLHIFIDTHQRTARYIMRHADFLARTPSPSSESIPPLFWASSDSLSESSRRRCRRRPRRRPPRRATPRAPVVAVGARPAATRSRELSSALGALGRIMAITSLDDVMVLVIDVTVRFIPPTLTACEVISGKQMFTDIAQSLWCGNIVKSAPMAEVFRVVCNLRR